ncbi:hypothetical protein [Streptomyces sp. NPDC005017]|uniref:hypothetical protein n=1 Tax=Streptomyces sp. NPDC005017 TaxID=3364706 RepID=UPI0036809A60
MLETGTLPTFAEILDELCRRPPHRGGRLSNTEIAQRVNAQGGSITDGYVSHLRTGQRDNPTLQTVQDLAAALDVAPAVFVGGRRERLGDERPRDSFPGKLRQLFAVVHPAGRGPYTPEEVSRAFADKRDYGSISASYLRELVNPPADRLPNPRLKHLLGLADHFGLSDEQGPQAAYFLDDRLAETIDAELDDYVALRDSGVIEFVTRMAEEAPHWSPEVRRQAVDAFVQAVHTGDPAWVFPARKQK